MHFVLELRWCGCCRRLRKRPLQVTLHSLHEGSVNNQMSVCLLCLRQHTGGCASGPVYGPRTELPGAFPRKDRCPHCRYSMRLWTPLMLCTCHTPRTPVTLHGPHPPWASHTLGTPRIACVTHILSVCLHHAHLIHLYIPHRGRVTYTVHASYPMPTSHSSHITLNVYTSHSMNSSHTCIPHTLCTPTLRNTLGSHILIF